MCGNDNVSLAFHLYYVWKMQLALYSCALLHWAKQWKRLSLIMMLPWFYIGVTSCAHIHLTSVRWVTKRGMNVKTNSAQFSWQLNFLCYSCWWMFSIVRAACDRDFAHLVLLNISVMSTFNWIQWTGVVPALYYVCVPLCWWCSGVHTIKIVPYYLPVNWWLVLCGCMLVFRLIIAIVSLPRVWIETFGSKIKMIDLYRLEQQCLSNF